MKLPGQRNWSTGTCTKKVNERSYVIKAGHVEYRRNRTNLIQCPQEPLPDVEDSSNTTFSPTEDKSTPSAAIEWSVKNATYAHSAHLLLHSPPYFEKAKKDLFAMIRQLGPASLFCSFATSNVEIVKKCYIC